MFRRMIFTGLFVAMLILPAFSSQITSESLCDYDAFGTYSGHVSLTAKWTPNISGEIELDDNIYANISDDTGVSPTTFALPNKLYSKYSIGIYTDSSAVNGTEISQLTSVPAKAGYDFNGFWTEKYQGGTQVIDSNGVILDAANTVIKDSGGEAIWYAQWIEKEAPAPTTVPCDAGEYLPRNTDSCEICLENNYCPGGTFFVSHPTDQGIVSCSDVENGGSKSPAGSKKADDCGYVLHIAEEKLYLHGDKNTNPSFVVEIEGKKWYADTTPVDDGAKVMSPGAHKRLHMEHNGTEYTVHGRYVE